MRLFPFGTNRKRDDLLSAYLDGELDPDDTDLVEERIVMEPDSADRLAGLARTAQLAAAALAPQELPDAGAVADRLLHHLGQTAAPGTPRRRPSPRRLGSAAVLASVGLIAAAGVTLVGLRRRGIV